MAQSVPEPHRALVDLLPQYLTRRMKRWDGRQPLLDEAGLAGPEAVLLRAMVMETGPGAAMSEAELRANLFNPYNTVHSFVDALPALVERGYLDRTGDSYTVTAAGRALIARIERAAQAYLATLAPLPAEDMAYLAGTLAELSGRMWAAPEPAAKPHQARVRRLPPAEGDMPMPRLDLAVYGLWMARDDAHNAAWRAAGLEGPVFDLLSQIWSGEAATSAELIARMGGQRPVDVERGLAILARDGLLSVDGTALVLTPEGRATRERIEAETDRVYFVPWPPYSQGETARLLDTFRALCEQLN
jgi:DNA-binding MarR family transcriptional regulator